MTSDANTIAVIKPSGLLDGVKAPIFRQDIDTLVQGGQVHVLVDLSETTFIDSSGLGALVAALKIARSVGGNLYLCGMNRQVRMVFELTSMDRAFDIYDHYEAFQTAQPQAS